MGSTTVHVIADVLRTALYKGEFATGEPLRQEDIAARFKVSRIPVREALSILANEGLLEIHPNRGAFVITHSLGEVQEIFDLRLLLETDSLRRAIPQLSTRTIRQLEVIQQALDVEEDQHHWLELDQAFHDTLYVSSKRTRTLELIVSLRAVLNRFYLALLTPNTNRDTWNLEHQAILNASKAGDANEAVRWLQRHLEKTAKLTVEQLTVNASSKFDGVNGG